MLSAIRILVDAGLVDVRRLWKLLSQSWKSLNVIVSLVSGDHTCIQEKISLFLQLLYNVAEDVLIVLVTYKTQYEKCFAQGVKQYRLFGLP